MSVDVPNLAIHNRIALVGIGCRVPGARDAEGLWRLVHGGVDALTELSEVDLLAAGVAPSMLSNPAYVRRAPLLDGIEMFDAPFFGLSSEQADLLDPQHRLFFECAYEALEDATQGPDRLRGSVGVFGGCSISSYLLFNLLPSMRAGASAATLLAMIGNEKDYLATHLSYLLGFTGPSVGVQSACSTSLAAVHIACQSLLSGECDLALAGGASVRVPQKVGYLFEEGSILSPTGRCCSFDTMADGTVFGSGVGVVALRRLEDALRDGDRIYSVILGSALNNDGNRKAGYTAPSVDGQAAAIAEALAVAGVEPGSIGLIEAHGTGTPIGDPIEFKALSEVFRGVAPSSVALGCVKANVGHLEAAAGVTGLIAASMALHRAQLPPVAHFRRANPLLGMDASPFSIGPQARPWHANGPRRAGVSSFGIGGSNVHVVLEQAPPPTVRAVPLPQAWAVLCASARSEAGLSDAVENLVDALGNATDLAAVSRASTFGRRAYEYRVAVTARSVADARVALAAAKPARAAANPKLALHFGDPRVAPASDAALAAEVRLLCTTFPRMRAVLELAAQSVPSIRTLLGNGAYQTHGVERIALQWALLEQLRDWGLAPAVCIGQGLGELAAAAAAGLLEWSEVLLAVDAYCRENVDPLAALSMLQPSNPRPVCALISAQSGQRVNRLTAEYVLSLADSNAEMLPVLPVREALEAQGITVLLTLALGQDAPNIVDSQTLELCALRGGESPESIGLVGALMNTLAALHAHGLTPDWRGVLGSGPRVALPFYPFQRRMHWRDAPGKVGTGQPYSGFPGQAMDTPLAHRMLRTTLFPDSANWLAEHRVDGCVVLPAAAYASLAIAAGMRSIGSLTIEHMLQIPAQGTPLQTVLDQEGVVEIHAQVEGKWLRHARARPGSDAVHLGRFDLAAASDRCSRNGDIDCLYQRMRDGGIHLGPSLQRFVTLSSGSNEALARLRPAADLVAGPTSDPLQVHPAILDALFQTLAVLVDDSGLGAHLPVSFDGLQLAPGANSTAGQWCHARLRPLSPGAIGLVGDLALLDATGQVLLKVDGLACLPARNTSDAFVKHLYVPTWVPQEQPAFISARPAQQPAIHVAALDEHLSSLADLDRLSVAYVMRAFQNLGAQFSPGQIVVLTTACEPRFVRLMPRLWLMLQEDGVMDAEHRTLRPQDVNPEALYNALRLRHPTMLAELGMLARCGGALAEVLTGRTDPLTLLFSKSSDDAPALYAQSSYAIALNQLAGDLLTPLLQAANKTSASLNILEIGGGTGGTTQYLLPLLSAHAAEYLFTDISPAFMEAAQGRFSEHECFRTALLDIEHDPAGQGIEAGSRHLVIAANVLHATSDLAVTIANARATLVPGGWLVLVEGLQPSRWLDLTFALTEGWWSGGDHARRPDYPFLDAQGWRDLLVEQGFGDISVHTPGAGRLADQGVIVARRIPVDVRRTTILCNAIGPTHPDNPASAVLAALQSASDAQAMLVATRGAQRILSWEQPDPEQAAVTGLLKAAALERSTCAMRSVDLDPLEDDAEHVLKLEAALDDGETDTAWRDGVRYVLRLQRHELPVAWPAQLVDGFRLVAQPGNTDAMELRPITRSLPGPDEVEIRVVAAGLNFKDVLMSLGTVAAAVDAGLGGECAGFVAAVGENVTAVVPGQSVVALAGGSFASHVIVPVCRVQLIPPALSFEQAAVLPIAGMTALHALRELVSIKAGQRVLIHSATGGVGLHCVALALAAGAEVFATAGSAVKRAYLRRLGVHHIFDSRSTAFAKQLRQCVENGGGVDVVVNSLSGEAIASGFSVLNAGGCFIEIGRAGIWTPEQARQQFPQVVYRIVALDRISDQEGGRLLRAVLDAAVRGELATPPITRIPMEKAAEAFRLMQRARHIGRVALTLPQAFNFRADRSYLITGGLGGLGLAVAEWAITRGARHLVLVSRSAPNGEQVLKLAELRALGAEVAFESVDVSIESAVADLAVSFGKTRPQLAGVFHAAGALDDAPLGRQDAARLARVRAAKLDAAEHLARHCRGLDAFVLFGSVAGLLGSAGQANHSAANAALDACAQRLYVQGVAVVCIAWGPWADIGAAARRGVGQRLAGTGMGEIKPDDGLAALGWMLDARQSRVAMMPIDWATFGRQDGTVLPPLFRALVPQVQKPVSKPASKGLSPRTDGRAGLKEIATTLSAMAPTRRGPWMESLVAEEARRLIGAATLPPETALTELGLDSLLAIELRNRLGTMIGASLPATLIFDHPSVRALGRQLLNLLTLPPPAPETAMEMPRVEASQEAAPTDATPTVPGAMSEAQVMALDADGLDAILRDLAARHLKP